MNTTYEQCFICNQDYSEKDISITKCNHKFHTSCLCNWLTIGKKCPYCNEKLVERNIEAINIEDLRRKILREMLVKTLNDDVQYNQEIIKTNEKTMEKLKNNEERIRIQINKHNIINEINKSKKEELNKKINKFYEKLIS